MSIKLQFFNGITLKRVIVITLLTMTIILAVYYLHPANNNWFYSDDFSFSNFLQFVFIDQVFIELITTFITLFFIVKYSKILKIDSLYLNPKSIVIYFLKFLPVLFLVYFIFSPLTINLRYLYHNLILNREGLNYLDSYFFLNSKLYAAYLPVVFLTGLQFLTIILLDSIKESRKVNNKSAFKSIFLKVRTKTGEKLIGSRDIVAIHKKDKTYNVYTNDDSFVVLKNLSQIEKELDSDFVRINRATIVNLKFYKEYSFWENEKYIFRMINGQEFNITRTRLNEVKQLIRLYNSKIINLNKSYHQIS